MGRVLALDLGARKTGVAVSDPGRTIALPHSVLRGDPIPQVVLLVEELDVELVVVGLPRGLSGADTDQTRIVRATTARLTAALDIPVEFVDERLTTRQVQHERAGMKLSRTARRSDDDAEAAALLLQGVLSARRS